MATDRVVLLTSEGESGRAAARYLAARFPALTVIVETPVSRSLLLRRRIKRLGPVQVGGQLAFMLFQRIQQRLSKSRIAEIVRNAGLDARWPDDGQIITVPSVNSAECIGHLQRLHPRAILVMGTRIIGAEVLRSVDAPFINYHAGVTPKYRGVHGGYWAKAQGDNDNFGVTIHLVDEGIDTGGILYQARPATTARDNYSSYPYLQLAAGLPLLERSARDAIAGTLQPQRVDLPSRLWSHPTLWGYIQTGLQRGVW